MVVRLSHVDEEVDVVHVLFQVLVLAQPLELLLDHLLGWQELVLEDVDQLRLELAVGDLLPHLQLPHLGDLDDRLLSPEDAQLVDAEK